ncbi:site-2 protease family protein [Actinomadura macrotermitis]|uniref:Putative zinc metalloprotease Rip2 n=1 Tax=Actinomadura macrotermitis TaxID=2585200 RepID=A0A7K0C010_9ACTN|nr:site-2 protease family protein [Actinomadura macrotermitis]MQY06783.1 putative zinc metalloprotease Rip2 [Actinomadura macrotermitis]
MGTVHRIGDRRPAAGPSPLFLAIVAVTVLTGLIAWRYGTIVDRPARIALFAFVVAGWIVTLCVHEFGHAYLAYRSGDHSVATRGYLTLNPLKYADGILSFAIPVLFILLGGIGFPGGAVWIDRGAIRGRLRHSLVSAAGPLTNVLFAIMIAVIFKNFAHKEHAVFWAGLAFLGFLQVTAALLNLLPIPGLDGFGIVEPYLPRSWVATANQYGGYAFLVLLALLWLVRPLNEAFFDLTYWICDAIGLGEMSIRIGHLLFKFWVS